MTPTLVPCPSDGACLQTMGDGRGECPRCGRVVGSNGKDGVRVRCASCAGTTWTADFTPTVEGVRVDE